MIDAKAKTAQSNPSQSNASAKSQTLLKKRKTSERSEIS